MASGILGTATSALIAFQNALATTGHNIANVNTDGYSRQKVDLSTQSPNTSGAGFIGSGVKVDDVKRMYDAFLETELRSGISARDRADAYNEFSSIIDNTLADPNSGLAPALQNFFDAVTGVANDPTSIPARQSMISESQSVADNFNNLDTTLSDLRKRIDQEFTNQINEVNDLASSIASVNKDIADAYGSVGHAPNDLLDQRDNLIQQLSSKVSVSTLEQSDHTMNVYIGNGQALVVGQTAGTLSVEHNTYDSQQLEIGFTFGNSGSTSQITDKITGGRLGGIIDFRDEVLNPVQDQLGQIAVTLAQTFNAQHDIGLNLDGNLGSSLPDYFTVTDPNNQVFSKLGAGSSAAVNVAFDPSNIDQLTSSEYKLSYSGATWTLTRLSDGTTNTGAGPFSVDGLTITPSGTAVAGDTFLLRPTRQGATDFTSNIYNPREIAAASAVRINSATNSSGISTNTGTGQFSAGSVSTSATLPLSTPITFTFDGTNTFNYSGGASGSITYNPATDSGKSFTVAGVTFSVTGTPAATDKFVITNNTNGVGDNRNALALANLQISKTMDNGTASYTDTYGTMVADVGVKTRRANTISTTQTNMVNQAQQRRDSLSGVNLDEEAADMLRFQQSYQAAARVVVVANSIFDSLLQATSR